MKRKPSEELRKLMAAGLEQATLHGLHAAADRAAEEIAWMQGYYRRVSEALKAGDGETFVDVQKELEFARSELVVLTDAYQEIQRFLGWRPR